MNQAGIANVLRPKPSDGLSKKDFWRTPYDVVDEVREALGGQMFDVCPSPNPDHWYAPTWAEAPHVDALSLAWPGRSFGNIPYSRMAPWMEHAFTRCQGVPQRNNPMNSCLVGRLETIGKFTQLSPKRWWIERK